MSADGSNRVGDTPRDAERDAWLRQALRHAPDAAAGAPPSVSDAILRQARQATASAEHAAHAPATASKKRSVATGREPLWAPLWSWLMQPTVASGFAGVMVATLVGVMWWGRPIDEPLREANLPDAAAPAVRSEVPVARADLPAPSAPTTPATPADPAPAALAAPAPVVVAPAAPATPQASGDSRRAAAQGAARALPPRAQDSADAEADKKLVQPDAGRALAENRAIEKARKAAPAEPNESQRRLAPAKPSPTGAAPEAPPTDALAAASPTSAGAPTATPPQTPAAGVRAANPFPERKREDEAMADSARPVAQARARDSDAAPPAAKTREPGPAQAALPATPQEAREITLGRSAAGATTGRLPSPSANPSLALRPAPEAAFTLPPGENPVGRVRAAVAASPEVWTWQRGSGAEQTMNDAVQAWLGQLDDATRARWQAGPAAAATGGPPSLRLLRNGRLHTTVRIEASAVRLETAGDSGVGAAAATPGLTPRAPLPAATAAALKAALELAAP